MFLTCLFPEYNACLNLNAYIEKVDMPITKKHKFDKETTDTR